MANRIYTNKNKGKVINNGRQSEATHIWSDDKGVWHAVRGAKNIPHWASHVEEIDYNAASKQGAKCQ